MIIRLAHKSDIPTIKRIIERNFDEIISKDHSIDVVEKYKAHNTEQSLLAQMQWKKIYVAIEDDEIIGTGAFANLTCTDKPNYCISNLYIMPEYQGKGVGHKIVEVLFIDFFATNADMFRVPSTRGAIDFYKKFGFIEDVEQPDISDEITWMTYTK